MFLGVKKQKNIQKVETLIRQIQTFDDYKNADTKEKQFEAIKQFTDFERNDTPEEMFVKSQVLSELTQINFFLPEDYGQKFRYNYPYYYYSNLILLDNQIKKLDKPIPKEV